ncbi:MAG: exopolyphosphatase [Beijerinckiaceae bacterium]|nr:exopolyphosphatase [Beijerinckiaceae bacterium]
MFLAKKDAPGRLAALAPVAIVDIGSNSVRLVAYEGLSRSPTPIFNDKVLCGLGRGVATTGRLPQDAVDRALAALRRFRVLCRAMEITDIHVLATAAARDAANGADFLAAAREAIGAPIELLSGKREAQLSALGVVSGFWKPDGVVGDLGGGSLELNDVKGAKLGEGVTLRLGGLSLMDISDRSPKKAVKIVRDALAGTKQLKKLEGRTFYAIGGTWRALARLHMRQRNYPLNVMHHYVIPARDAADFAALVERVHADTLISIGAVPSARRPLLAYGAVVLDEIIRQAKPKEIVVSALGVREGLLFERLDAADRKRDPLLVAARELNVLRSRAPQHGEELCAWTDAFMRSTHLEETQEETRLRHAACLLTDIGWRAHPDYRGEQSLNIIAHAAFIGIDHPGRAFLALAASYRHMGPEEDVSPQIRTLATARMLDRAHILGAAMRLAYVVTAAMPGVLPRAPLLCVKDKVVLTLPGDLADLANERVQSRMKQLSRLIGREGAVRTVA